MQAQTKKVKVGFDLDGVLLYNPLRIGRPIVTLIKKRILRQPARTQFHIPRTDVEKHIWRLLHKFSLFTSPGFHKIKSLVDEGKIEAYLVTARYSFLKDDLDEFVRRNNAKQIFTSIIYNKDDEQPHVYKERIIKALDLDYFVEDNWDIVEHLSNTSIRTQIIWMYNLLDMGIQYPHKFAHLRDAIAHIMKAVNL